MVDECTSGDVSVIKCDTLIIASTCPNLVKVVHWALYEFTFWTEYCFFGETVWSQAKAGFSRQIPVKVWERTW